MQNNISSVILLLNDSKTRLYDDRQLARVANNKYGEEKANNKMAKIEEAIVYLKDLQVELFKK